jgi:hypothetical protein
MRRNLWTLLLLSHLAAPVNAVTTGNKRDWFSTKKP